MIKRKSKTVDRSLCCGAMIRIAEDTTVHYECSKCGEACDVYFHNRKFWKRNPITQICGDNREKAKEKNTKKEIKENL